MENITSYLNRRINAVLGRSVLENVVVDSIIIKGGAENNIDTREFVLEAKTVFNQIPGVKHYTYRVDPQLGEGGPGRQRHIHIYYDGKQVFAMNADSTAHDGCHQAVIPKELNTFLNKKGFPVPPNNIIEFYQMPSDKVISYEVLDYAALNNLALSVGDTIRQAQRITIIEANVETYQVKKNTKVFGKYVHVNQLTEVPQEYLCEIKNMIIDLLKEIGKYNDDNIVILDDNYSPHRLFVAWS